MGDLVTTPMVRITDEGSFFEAPIDVVWEYFLGAGGHDTAHPEVRNTDFKRVSETSTLITGERDRGRGWMKDSVRVTLFQPLGWACEDIEGLFAGSKMFFLYTPRGHRTQIDVYGEFTSAIIPPAELEEAIRNGLAAEFDEDAPLIKKFAREK
jgi:hypothetical protein